MKINYERLLQDYGRMAVVREGVRPDIGGGESMIKEHLKAKQIDPRNFDFGRLWAAAFGEGNFQRCRADRDYGAVRVMEGAGPVTTASFQSITKQIIQTMIMDEYESPEFVFSKLIPRKPSNESFEKMLGVSRMGNAVAIVKEGQKYPVAGMAESWQNLAETVLRGFMVQLTRQIIFFDKTGLVQQRAKAGARELGEDNELRAIDCVIDENTGAKSAALGGHRYHYEGSSIATYGNNSGSHSWDNLAGTNALVDWTDLDAADQLLAAMTDPKTSQIINIGPAKHLVCGRGLKMTALRNRNATEITVVTPGYATSGNPTETKVANPWGNQFEVVTNGFVESRLATDTHWFWGDITRAFAYVENWAPAVSFLGSGTQLEFEQEIIEQYKFNEYGNYTTVEPRAIVQCTVA